MTDLEPSSTRRPLVSNASIIEEIQKEKLLLGGVCDDIKETKTSISLLEEKIIKADNGNDRRAAKWKSRYLNQVRINGHMEQEKNKLKEQVENERVKIINGWSNFPYLYDVDNEMSEAEWLRLLRQLEMVKNNLVGELRNVQWRMDQESTVFHQMNELCTFYKLEISVAKSNTATFKELMSYEEKLSQISTLPIRTTTTTITDTNPMQLPAAIKEESADADDAEIKEPIAEAEEQNK